MAETLLELAERVEAATGPDRELDLAIAEATSADRVRNGSINISRNVTASLDAAMTLVPEGWSWFVGDAIENRYALVYRPFGHTSGCPATLSTPALALCAAALKARASKEDGVAARLASLNADRERW